MNLAVKKYQDVSYQPEGMPDEWPAEVIELGESTTLPAGDGWVLMTTQELADHRAEYQEDYDTWWAQQPPPPELDPEP